MLLFAIHKIVASASRISGRCAALAAFYTTGMTVALMGFAMEPLALHDCLLQCYESVNTAGTPTAVKKAVLLDKT